jgi:hypothetical protein
MTIDIKFAFIIFCFVVALFSCIRCYSKKDWAFLVCGLGATVFADFFLVMQHQYVIGVAIFCFTHVFYIFRIVEFTKRAIFLLCAFFAVWVSALALENLIIFAALYAALFMLNIYVNIKNHRNQANFFLVMTGLIMFALCDINVALINLPRYFVIPHDFNDSFALIWIFYLPSQALLALSAIRYHPLEKRPKPIQQKIKRNRNA